MWKLIAIASTALLLSGCSAASNVDSARSVCISAAEEEVGASIDSSQIEAASFSDALFETGITDDRKLGDGDDLFTVTGDFTYEKDGTQSRRSMLCTVKYTGGEAEDPDLTVIGG